MSRFLLILLVVASVIAPAAYGQAVAQIVTSRSLPQATIDLIDPETGISVGSGSSSIRLAPGDVILLRTTFTPVVSAAVRGLQGFLTEYLPPNTELIGVRIIDSEGTTIEPRYPGIAVDGCVGGTNCNTFNALPCSGGACSFPSGSIAQVHAETGLFFSNDVRLTRNPASSFLTMGNGISMSPEPTMIDPSVVQLLGDVSGSYFAHNDWDWAQVRAYGTSSAASGSGGDGNTPYFYGSPVAGSGAFYRYEATEVSGTIQFNNTVGPWVRIRYPGSTTGVGDSNVGASTDLTRALVETTAGYDLTPATAVAARAVRLALGETRGGERGIVELALRVTALPLDPAVPGDVACAEATGSDISSRGGTSGARHNPWPFYVGSPACADLRLQLDLDADKHLASSGETVQYSLHGRNLAVTAETNAVVRMKYDAARQSFVSAIPSPASAGTCTDDASLVCLRWNLGVLQPSQEYDITAAFSVGGGGHTYNSVYANHQSDQTPAPGRTTQVVTTVTPLAIPKITLATSFDPTVASAAAGSTSAMTGTVRNAGTASWTQDSIAFVLPTGWSISGAVTLGGVTLSCSSGCGTAKPTYMTATTYAPNQSRALAFNVSVPAGTATGLYRMDVQTWGNQAVAGAFETYFPRAAFVAVGASRTHKPVVTCPIRHGTSSIGGTAEANAAISLQFNAIERGTATATGAGNWSSTNYAPFGAIYGGLEVTAVATAPGKLESERSLPCFVINFDCGRAPLATNTGPYCEGGTVMLATDEVAGASYSWTGPNGFISSERAPVIAGATAANGGTYSVTITIDDCTSQAGTTDVVIDPPGATPSEFATASASVVAGDMDVPYAVELVADVTYHWSYSGSDVAINGSGHSVMLDFYPTATSGTLSVVAENECGPSGPRSLAIAVAPPPLVAPPAINASASGMTEVVIGWSYVPTATYEIFRSNGDGATLVLLAATSDTIYIDTAVSPNTTYLYAVRARRGDEASPLGPIDPATTMVFADDPLYPGNVCRASHITQLRTAVDAMRAAAGLQAGIYADGAAAGSLIRGNHILELRSGLDEARSLLQLAPIVYIDPTITAGSTTPKATHIEQLRNGVK